MGANDTMKCQSTRNRSLGATLALVAGVSLLSSMAWPAGQAGGSNDQKASQPTLEETRLTMEKWIETQQILSKERNEWQQGKEILLGRLELVRKEVATLEEKIEEARAKVEEASRKREELVGESDRLKDVGSQLTEYAAGMEEEVRKLLPMLPEPIQTRLEPLVQRVPADSQNTHATAAERFQNVLGILNELNKTNNEITVSYEVRDLSDGKPAEVKVLYVGLAQAYFVSARGEAGIGQPGPEGWTWRSSNASARDVLTALEILEGKQTPAFVPLPVEIR